ncbi:MAG: sigma-70 family RNA polymerase sigma factor [Oscillospiraceae bacterium]|nr:sigma-70 family RNA polymerase sigma factor [Oscillospiraceae bacterium]
MDETEKLIKRAQTGDSEAFETLMAPLEKRVYGLALRITNNREDAFDCTQETMLRAFRSITDYRFQGAFTTWVFRITTNVCLDMIRRRRIKPYISLELMQDSGFTFSDKSSNPLDEIIRDDLNQDLKVCISKLPLDQRVIVILRDIQGLAYEDIAAILKISLGTVKSRLSRARERIRKMMYRRHGTNLEELNSSRGVNYVRKENHTDDL